MTEKIQNLMEDIIQELRILNERLEEAGEDVKEVNEIVDRLYYLSVDIRSVLDADVNAIFKFNGFCIELLPDSIAVSTPMSKTRIYQKSYDEVLDKKMKDIITEVFSDQNRMRAVSLLLEMFGYELSEYMQTLITKLPNVYELKEKIEEIESKLDP
jgi:hypothetical protein